MLFSYMGSLSKQANKWDPLLILLSEVGVCLSCICMHFVKHARSSLVEHGVDCYFGLVSFRFFEITSQSHRAQLLTS